MNTKKLAKLQAKLDGLNKKGGSKDWDEINKKLWKPEPGDNIIRIVPYAKNLEWPMIDFYFYYGIGKGRLYSYKTVEESDPIVEYGMKVRNINPVTGEQSSKVSKDVYKSSFKYFPVHRTFVPIIVRGKESDGVKYWEFGDTINRKLMSLYVKVEDYNDLDSLKDGHDITVTYRTPQEAGNDYGTTDILPKPKPTPATTDATIANMIQNEQPDIDELIYKHSKDKLQQKLENYLSGLDAEDDSSEIAETTTESTADVENKFNDLMSKTDDTSDVELSTDDELPETNDDAKGKYDGLFD